MLSKRDDELLETIIDKQGLTEDNCLSGLTDQQRKCWVKWAILGWSEERILADVFGHRKLPSKSTVTYAIADAQMRIADNILRDYEPIIEGHKPKLWANLQDLLSRVRELKARKCRKPLPQNN